MAPLSLDEEGEPGEEKEVCTLRSELWEKERKLTDIRLEALSSAHQLEQLQELGLVPLLVGRLDALARQEEEQQEEVEEAEPAADRAEAGLTAGMSPSEMLSSSCFESFDFPSLDGRREEARDQGPGSSSFLSLRLVTSRG